MSNCVTHHACECIEADRKRLREDLAAAVEVLRSIADNTCCDKCQEAARVAASFLARLEVKL